MAKFKVPDLVVIHDTEDDEIEGQVCTILGYWGQNSYIVELDHPKKSDGSIAIVIHGDCLRSGDYNDILGVDRLNKVGHPYDKMPV